MSNKQKTKRGPKERTRGRESGGLACIGCVEFTQTRNAAGGFTGRGWCAAHERAVPSADRRPCGLYLSQAKQRLEQAASVNTPRNRP